MVGFYRARWSSPFALSGGLRPPEPPRCRCINLNFIWIYLNLFEFIWVYLNLFEFIWFYMNLFEFIDVINSNESNRKSRWQIKIKIRILSLDPLWILSQDQDPTRYAIHDARNPIREMGNRETRNRELRYQSQSKSKKPFANNRIMRASGTYTNGLHIQPLQKTLSIIT